MKYKYFLQSFQFDDFLRVSILRKKRLFDERGREIKLDQSEANYRCVLTPSPNVEKELEKLTADGVTLNPELQKLVDNELKQTLELWWTTERIADYQELQGASEPSSFI